MLPVCDRSAVPQAINAKFPDMAALVEYGHGKGLRMGWYLNGCACGEHVALDANYEGDVRSLHDFGFDGVKMAAARRGTTRNTRRSCARPARATPSRTAAGAR
jgi:hypothetical protein